MQGGKREGAGRPAGSRNKRTLAVLDLLGDFHPIDELARIAQDEATPLEVRIDCLKTLLPYTAAKVSPIAPMAFERKHNPDPFGV